MKRASGLWPEIVAFDNLLLAYRKARRGKRNRIEVARFALELESNLLTLRDELRHGRYRPGAYRLFQIYDRKPRRIAAAPFRDRVVHHALMNRVEPVLDSSFIDDSYACRTGRGVHAAVERYRAWANRYEYALKLDVRGYFPSIDHAILKRKLRRRIKDQAVLDLFDLIIGSAPGASSSTAFAGADLVDRMEHRTGLPIGNLTSQFLGNLYLDDLDHFIKQTCRAPAYLRYVDDLVLLGNDKGWLWETSAQIEAFLARERLSLHRHKVQLQRTGKGIDLLGYRVFPHGCRLRSDSGYRFRRRLRAKARDYAVGRVELAEVHASVAAWIGHVRHAESLGLRKAVLDSVCFQRAADRTLRASCGSRRRLEQQTGEPPVGQPQQEHTR